MKRHQVREIFSELHIPGELWRGRMLIQVGRRDWRVFPRMTLQQFYRRQDARDWIDKTLGFVIEQNHACYQQVV